MQGCLGQWGRCPRIAHRRSPQDTRAWGSAGMKLARTPGFELQSDLESQEHQLWNGMYFLKMRTHEFGTAKSCKTHKAHDSHFFLCTTWATFLRGHMRRSKMHACNLRLWTRRKAPGSACTKLTRPRIANGLNFAAVSSKRLRTPTTTASSPLIAEARCRFPREIYKSPGQGRMGASSGMPRHGGAWCWSWALRSVSSSITSGARTCSRRASTSRPVAMRMRQRSNLKRRTTCQSQLSGEDGGWHQILAWCSAAL